LAALQTYARINSTIEIDVCVEDVYDRSIAGLAGDCDLILDGTDNFETRFLVNDFCVREKKPWIHAGCLGASGQILSIVPGKSACFRCLVPDLPPRDGIETCDSAGVLGSAIGIIASWQAGEALKVLSGNEQAVCPGLIVLDTWNNDCRIVDLRRSENCPCCVHGEFPFLDGEIRTTASILCGKNAVQLERPQAAGESLDSIARKVAEQGVLKQNAYFVKLALPEHQLTIFRGGRTIVEGTTCENEARNIVTRLLGS